MAVNEPSNQNLYHIQVIRTYLEYLSRNYPSLDTDYILEYSGLSKLELDDDGYWCTQEQTDRFQEIVERLTGNPNVAREAGRYGTTSTSYQIIRQYITSFLDPAQAYALLGRIGSKLSRGAKITIKKMAPNKVEAIVEIYPGVHEKKYQCLNRLGLMEALAGVFTGEWASVEHTECIHEGAKQCRYIITWNVPVFLKLRQLRNYLLLIGCAAIITGSFFLAFTHLIDLILLFSLIFYGFSSYVGSKEKQELRHHIENQGKVAEQLMAESNRRYNDAELMQELGRTISSVLDIDELLNVAMQTLKKHLEYDRGMILLADSQKIHLKIAAVYGHTDEHLNFFRGIELHLDNPKSKGPFVVAFRDRQPILVNDVDGIMDNLSERTREIVAALGARSFVCVPIVYKDEPLGVLSLDNTHAAHPPKQSDLNLLMGIAPQIAICINNARTFERMQASEEKYRVLVESANSIILRIDTQGTITFTNRFAQQFFGYSEQEMVGRNILGLIVPKIDMKGRDTLPAVQKLLSGHKDYLVMES
jgi:GAF domain-containing protein